MFGYLKKKKYPDLSMKYRHVLEADLGIKQPLAATFINNRGDQLSYCEMNMKDKHRAPEVSSGYKKMVADFGYEHCTVVSICISIYFTELTKGKPVSDEEEILVVAVLLKLKEITNRIDPSFSEWLYENKELKWPGIFKKVFKEGF